MAVWANAARPLICLRKSVAPGRTNTRTFSHSGNTGRLPYHAQHGPKDSLLVTAQELDVSVASDSDESLADRSAMVAPVVDLHQDILLSVPRNRLVQRRSDSVLTPCSLHQSRLVLPLAFHAETNRRHSAADRCRCFRSLFFVAIEDLLSSLSLRLRIAPLTPCYKVRLF